ncbi:oligopeptide transport ATP-binding protein AppF [Aeromonas hydrophila]|nr:oligopeptide transport ATP-binding protein AppF [Aeromonas hydrophila]
MQIAQTDAPIIEVQHLYKDFPVNSNAIKSGKMRALSDITFNLHRGRALAVVGESGSGKSTIAKIIAKMYKLSGGRILYRGRDLEEFNKGTALLDYRQSVQMVWQDPFGSLNPTHTIYHHIARPLLLHSKVIDKKDLPDMVYGLLEKVGLTPAKATAAKYPHQLSGGQRQRVNIARNLAVEAEVVLADEPTSMLDVSIRIGILNLMEQMKDELGVSMLYITHDIATARYVAEDLAVMYVGHMVEWGEVDEILHHPQHPYTQLLISAVPDPEKSIHAELEGAARGRSRSGRRSPAAAPSPGAAIRRCPAARRPCPPSASSPTTTSCAATSTNDRPAGHGVRPRLATGPSGPRNVPRHARRATGVRR